MRNPIQGEHGARLFRGDTFMFTKAALTLSALLIACVSTVARADEDIENRLGDRYPFLEQQYRPITGNVGRWQMNAPQYRVLPQYMNEAVEDKIGDRYPLLEQPIQFANVGTKV